MAKGQFSIDINNCGFFDAQIQLGAALADANIRNFRMALDMGAEATVEDDNHMSIFEKALKTHGCAEFVDECLRRGCDPNYINRHLGKAAINFAVDSRDPRIVSALLSYKGVQVDRKYADLTPLNSLAKNLTAENAADVGNCMELLLACGASPNIPDQREMTPLHYILKNRKIDANKKRELVQLFMTQSDVDLDTYRNGEMREIVSNEYPDVLLPPMRSTGANFETLLTHLSRGDEDRFAEQFAVYKQNMSESEQNNLSNAMPEQNLQLFMESIKRGLHGAFDTLLQSNLNYNMLQAGNSAIELAAKWGNWHALKQLLHQDGLKLRRQDQLLTTVIKHLDEKPLNDFCDYNKCFDAMLESKRVDINETDPSGSTPLHYAVKYRNREATKALLRHGAYIGIKSAFSDLPIDGIHPELLQEHFDDCISTNGLQPGDESYEIVMNYVNLIPPQNEYAAAQPTAQRKLREEMAPITFIAETKEYTHLLQHPLITSFLFLKWHRLSVVFYINFLIYVLFAVSIVTHTMLKFNESENATAKTLFGLFSWIGIGYLLVREFIQVVISPSQYLHSPINLMEVALIVLSVMTCSEPLYDRETQRVIAVFTILLVALELCLLVGSLPVLSISTHMLMLRAVSKSFLKSFALYSIFVITFSLCFHILFGKPEQAVTADPATGEATEGEFNKFTNPFAAIIKTIVMLTGEFDASDIDFDSMYSYFVFLLFVVFMSIVLFNLLNGLAVNDTQTIKAQAELNGSICRANLLTRYEQVLTGRTGRASFIVNHEPFRTICRRLMNIYPNYLIGRQIAILPNDRNKIMVPIASSYEMNDVMSRGNGNGNGNGVRNSKTTFLPLTNNGDTDYQKKLLDPPVQFLPCGCSCITGKCSEMDSRTVKLAMAIIEQRTAKQQSKHNMDRRLQSIEFNQEKLFQMLQRIEEKFNQALN